MSKNVTVIAYANRKGSDEPPHLRSPQEPMFVADVRGRPRGDFSQRTRQVHSPRAQACKKKKKKKKKKK